MVVSARIGACESRISSVVLFGTLPCSPAARDALQCRRVRRAASEKRSEVKRCKDVGEGPSVCTRLFELIEVYESSRNVAGSQALACQHSPRSRIPALISHIARLGHRSRLYGKLYETGGLLRLHGTTYNADLDERALDGRISASQSFADCSRDARSWCSVSEFCPRPSLFCCRFEVAGAQDSAAVREAVA